MAASKDLKNYWKFGSLLPLLLPLQPQTWSPMLPWMPLILIYLTYLHQQHPIAIPSVTRISALWKSLYGMLCLLLSNVLSSTSFTILMSMLIYSGMLPTHIYTDAGRGTDSQCSTIANHPCLFTLTRWSSRRVVQRLFCMLFLVLWTLPRHTVVWILCTASSTHASPSCSPKSNLILTGAGTRKYSTWTRTLVST